MAKTATGVDIGLRTCKFIRGQYKGNTFHATEFGVENYETDELGAGWEWADLGFKPLAARVGLSGRDVNIRYTRVPRVPDWQLRNLMRFEVSEIGDQSGVGVSSDFNLLPEMPEIEGEDIVLLAMARENLLEKHMEGLAAVGGKLDAFSPNAVALYNAWLRYGVVQEDTVLVANIGHDNLDVAIARGPDLLFARNLSGGSRLFEDAIAQRFSVGSKKAEEIKIEMATLAPNARFTDPNQEKASRAILGAAGQLLSLLQSTILFCKSQVKISGLKCDRVMLCGGGAALEGLPEYLSAGMGMPVELFDPFRVVDTSGLEPEAAERLDEYKLESVVALGLATMASDPEAYSLEIIPERMQKARAFWGKTAYLLAAALLGVLYLGWETVKTRSELTEYTAKARRLGRDLDSANRTDRQTRELLTENEELFVRSQLLQGVAGSGEQVARVLEVLENELPADFWVTELSTVWAANDALGVANKDKRPILHLEGRGRQGTGSLTSSYQGFVASLETSLPGVVLDPKLKPNGTEFTVDLTCFRAPVLGEEPGDEGDDEPDDEGRDGENAEDGR